MAWKSLDYLLIKWRIGKVLEEVSQQHWVSFLLVMAKIRNEIIEIDNEMRKRRINENSISKLNEKKTELINKLKELYTIEKVEKNSLSSLEKLIYYGE